MFLLCALFFVLAQSANLASDSIYLSGTVKEPVFSPDKVVEIESGTVLEASVYSGIGIHLVILNATSNTTSSGNNSLILVRSEKVTEPFLVAPTIYVDSVKPHPYFLVKLTTRSNGMPLFRADFFTIPFYYLEDDLNQSACTVSTNPRDYRGGTDRTTYMNWQIYCSDYCLTELFSSTLVPLFSGATVLVATLVVVLCLNFLKWANLPFHTRVFRTFCPLFVVSCIVCFTVITLEVKAFDVYDSFFYWSCPEDIGGTRSERRIYSQLVGIGIFGTIPITVAVVWASLALIVSKVPSQKNRDSWVFSMSPRSRAALYLILWMFFIAGYLILWVAAYLAYYNSGCEYDCQILDFIVKMMVGIIGAIIEAFILAIVLAITCCRHCKNKQTCKSYSCCYGDWLIDPFRHCDDGAESSLLDNNSY